MSPSIYQLTVAVFIQRLGAMEKMLDKLQAFADAKKLDSAVFLKDRLYPDMFDLTRQIQITADFAKNGCARLAGMDPPKIEDKESSLAELKARIQKTIDILRSLQEVQFTDAATREIVFKIRDEERRFVGAEFVLNWVIPHFYFHYSMVYAMLRHRGIELGKSDYLS
jgi:uncharacterized protein